ncbi:MAG: hypothetical protein FJ125_17590, partial [Deltaproteobacteria bacterium]|nr:hypothetical protein [Deltaproteobacteria bacterium]
MSGGGPRSTPGAGPGKAAQATEAAAGMLRRLRLQGLLSGRPATGPQTVHIDIANACNTRCTTCWHHSPLLTPERRPSADWLRRLLPLSAFCSILGDLRRLGGLEQVILSGMGEPFLNPDVYAMVAEARGQGLDVTIITNLLAADLARLLSAPPQPGRLDLLVSVCGASAASWQAFHAHPRPDGFARLVEQLAQLRRLGLAPKQVQVVNRQNCDELPEMVRFARRTGARQVSFKLASLGGGTEAVALEPAQQERLRRKLIPEAMALAERFDLQTDLTAFASQIHPDPLRTAPIEQVGCYMGYLYCRITVEQELLFCCSTSVPVGRIDEATPLSAMWRSARYQELRDALRQGRFFPGCA